MKRDGGPRHERRARRIHDYVSTPELEVPVHDGSLFTWARTAEGVRMGYADESDIVGRTMARVWNDSADEGFVVRSHRTGRRVLFTFVREARDPAGEATAWVFAAVDDPGLEVHIVYD